MAGGSLADIDDDRARAPGGFPWPPLMLIGLFVAISLVVIIGRGVLDRTHEGHRVLTDATFTSAASALCRASLPQLRPQSTAKEDTVSPLQAADATKLAADGIATLAAAIRALPVAPDQATPVSEWLSDWDSYADTGRRFSDLLRANDIDGAYRLSKLGEAAQQRADRFARANSLSACQFAAVIRPPAGSRSF